MKAGKIIFAVFDTLDHEYRGYKTAVSFMKKGYEVKVIGIRYGGGELKGWDDIETARIRLGKNYPLMLNMIIFWVKLTFHLILGKSSLLYSHDIFPLLPVFTASLIKRIPYIYDAHEFWHGNSQVENRPAAKRFWTSYERTFIRKASGVITVSHSIADELKIIYNLKKVTVIPNMPLRKKIPEDRGLLHRELGIGEEEKIILYQGHFLVNNGLDTVVRAYAKTGRSSYLVLIGEGSEKGRLKALAQELGVENRVLFAGPYPHNELINYTVCAHIGLCLIKNFGKSYYYSSPNKMFEFIQAGVPQIASDFPEISRYINESGAGELCDPENTELIARKMELLVSDCGLFEEYRKNCIRASEEYLWEKYEDELISASYIKS